MSSVENEVDRTLSLLRDKIRAAGYTQLDVQRTLNWGRSYLSQLFTKQKSLRADQVLSILQAIGVDPKDFYAELYDFQRPDRRGSLEDARADYRRLMAMVQGLVQLLVDKDVVSPAELEAAATQPWPRRPRRRPHPLPKNLAKCPRGRRRSWPATRAICSARASSWPRVGPWNRPRRSSGP